MENIKWMKFYNSATGEVITLTMADGNIQNDGETDIYDSAETALKESTIEVYVVWDGIPIGLGTQTA